MGENSVDQVRPPPLDTSAVEAIQQEASTAPVCDSRPSLRLVENPRASTTERADASPPEGATTERPAADLRAHTESEPIRIPLENTLAHLVAAFTELPRWQGVFAFNELSRRIVFRRPAPFQDNSRLGHELREDDITDIRLWFERETAQSLSVHNVLDAIGIVARRNRFHPVQDYLRSLTWDGVPQVHTWLEDYCSVKSTSPEHLRLTRAVARKWLIACVARALTPGAKVDAMLVLEGRQGIGKSRAVEALAGTEFFSDAPIDFRTKDAMQLVQGVWIYELAELDAILRGESPATKAFLSRSTDTFRPPYARVPVSIPRSVVFCGTVNHGGYLKDSTGNRRFWIVRCEGNIDVEGLRAQRDRLWGEARALFEKGEAWHLTSEEEALMHAEHQDRMEDDPWEERIAAWLSRQGARPLAMEEILSGALGLQAAARNPNVTRRVRAILEPLGFERQRRSFQHGAGRSYRYVHAPFDAPLPACPTGSEQHPAPPDEDDTARPTTALIRAPVAKQLSKKTRSAPPTSRRPGKSPSKRRKRRR